jgi:AraC-like DNA-binding protein
VDEIGPLTGNRLVRWSPAQSLRGDVVRFTGYAEVGRGPLRYVELPPTFVAVIFSFGSPYRVRSHADPPQAAERLPSFVGGLIDSPVVVDSDGRALCVQVDLTPLAASRFLGIPMHELAGRVAVRLDDLLEREVEWLEERLADASGWEERCRLVESFVAGRIAAAPSARPDVSYAWRRLEETGGSLRIGDLAAELGCSRKHLLSVFREHVGVPPKAVAMLQRFNRALGLVERGVDGAHVAYRCGYADQSHFVNEFRRFAGLPPSAFARTPQVQFLQDAGDRAA